jgi:predicted AlkP superfamily phosphohydrolase/phosphomutase
MFNFIQLAYIDPGTTGFVYGMLGSILAGLIAFGAIIFQFSKHWGGRFWALVKRYKLLFVGGTTIILLVLILGLFGVRIENGERLLNMQSLEIGKNGDIISQEAPAKRVLVLGMDGLDFRLVKKLIEEDKLPSFKKLSESGSFIPLEPSMPPESPVSWSSIATGKNPGEHNLFDFIGRDTSTYFPQLSILEQNSPALPGREYKDVLKGVPFWQASSEAGKETSVVRWPITFPAQKIKGHMLSGLGVPDINGMLNKYSFYTDDKNTKPSDSASKVYVVEENKGTIQTQIEGPIKKGAFSSSPTSVPMEIEIPTDKKSVTLKISGKNYDISVGGWSDWITLEFKTGVLRNVTATAKAYLEEVTPNLKLYITSLQIDPKNPVFKISHPNEYSAELANSLGLFYTQGMPEDTQALNDGRISDSAFLEQSNQIMEEREKMLWFEMDRFKTGVLAFVFDSTDRIQHMFWRNNVMDKDYNVLTMAPEIEDYYIRMDSILGRVLEKLDPETALIICSDHGFNSFNYQIDINRWLVENNFMKLKGELDQKNWGALFSAVDWSETSLYSFGFTSVYLNKTGREHNGIVSTEMEEKIANEFITRLEQLTNANGEKVVEKVYRKNELYKGKYLENAPDFIIGFRPGYRMSWQTAIGGAYKDVISPNTKKWSGDHLIDSKFVPGIFLSSFPVNHKDLQVEDVAPIILNRAGVSKN